MSDLRRVQFIKPVVFTKSPYETLNDAESPLYVIKGEGPYVRVSKGDHAVIVPWSNIAVAELQPEPAVVPVAQPQPTDARRSATYPAAKGVKR